MKFLFIGGVADGTWIDVHYKDSPPLTYAVVIALPTKVPEVYFSPTDSITMERKSDHYRLSTWHTDSGTRGIYVKMELKDFDVLGMLISNYRKS